MFFARYFPGLALTEERLNDQVPEATSAMRRAGERILKAEGEERVAHTKGIMQAAAGRRLF